MKSLLTPGLQAAKDNPDIVFLELNVEDTSPTLTMGFTDDQIREMKAENLRAEMKSCDEQELMMQKQITEIKQRKFVLSEILDRKAVI